MSKQRISATLALLALLLVLAPFAFAGDQVSIMDINIRSLLNTSEQVAKNTIALWFSAFMAAVVSMAAYIELK
jgi:hypothetical protein